MSRRHGHNGHLSSLAQSSLGRLASHWVFQGLLYMDPTERLFKIAIDASLTAVLSIALAQLTHPISAIVLSALGAHSLNLLFNGQIWVAIRHGFGHMEPDTLLAHLDAIADRLCGNPSVQQVYVYGSLARGELHTGSDLDLRVLRSSGFVAGFRVSAAVALERTRAFLQRLPLDIYVCDSPRSLEKMRRDELPQECCLGKRGS